MIIPDHVEASLRQALHEAMPGSGVQINRVHDDAMRTGVLSTLHVQLVKHAGPNAIPLEIEVAGWGNALQESVTSWKVAVDFSWDSSRIANHAIRTLRSRILQQNERASEALSAGLVRPLKGDEILSTSHLSIDLSAANTIIDFIGSKSAARNWVDESIGLYHKDESSSLPTWIDPVVRIVGSRLHIPFMLSPLRPSRSGGPMNSPVWEDDAIYVDQGIPETIAIALRGKALRNVISGTPIDERVIKDVVDASIPGAASFMIMIEPMRGKLDDLLPPA